MAICRWWTQISEIRDVVDDSTMCGAPPTRRPRRR